MFSTLLIFIGCEDHKNPSYTIRQKWRGEEAKDHFTKFIADNPTMLRADQALIEELQKHADTLNQLEFGHFEFISTKNVWSFVSSEPWVIDRACQVDNSFGLQSLYYRFYWVDNQGIKRGDNVLFSFTVEGEKYYDFSSLPANLVEKHARSGNLRNHGLGKMFSKSGLFDEPPAEYFFQLGNAPYTPLPSGTAVNVNQFIKDFDQIVLSEYVVHSEGHKSIFRPKQETIRTVLEFLGKHYLTHWSSFEYNKGGTGGWLDTLTGKYYGTDFMENLFVYDNWSDFDMHISNYSEHIITQFEGVWVGNSDLNEGRVYALDFRYELIDSTMTAGISLFSKSYPPSMTRYADSEAMHKFRELGSDELFLPSQYLWFAGIEAFFTSQGIDTESYKILKGMERDEAVRSVIFTENFIVTHATKQVKNRLITSWYFKGSFEGQKPLILMVRPAQLDPFSSVWANHVPENDMGSNKQRVKKYISLGLIEE
ncbi:MAG: hypothetical protein HQ556_05475 [Candidatus Marinimicrobia bacterium]|nr:hypothetical protein [Candidatus Neomarinimicrobiota bacterium]